MASLVPGLDANDFRIVEENAIGNDFSVEPCGAELARDELRGFVVLGRRGQVRLGSRVLRSSPAVLGSGTARNLCSSFASASKLV